MAPAHSRAAEPNVAVSSLQVKVFPSAPRRLAAAAVDLGVLWLITELLAALYESEFIALGRSGRFVGALFFLAYVGGQNSTFTGGRTLGKRLCRLRVVDQTANSITLERSMLRALMVLIPLIAHGVFAFPSDAALALAVHVLLVVITVGYGAVLGASYLLTGTTGQALHDRVLKTYVVRHECTLPPWLTTRQPKRRYVIVVCGWLLLCTIVGTTRWLLWGGAEWSTIITIRSQVSSIEGINRAEVFIGNFYFRDSTGVKRHAKYLEVRALFSSAFTDFPEKTLSVADALLNSVIAARFDAVRVTVGYEFDLLFARRRWLQSTVHTPDDWRKLLHPGATESATILGSLNEAIKLCRI